TPAPSKTSTPPAPGSPPTCPGTTSSTATAASLCSPRHKSTAGLGRRAATNATAPTRLTTTPTLNGSGDARAPQHPAPSSESTSPPKPNPTDSRQLDNDRWVDLCEWIAPFRRSRRAGGASILAGVSEPSVAELRNRLDGLTIRDAARLGRRLKSLRGRVGPEKLQQIAEQFTVAEALIATRKAAVPAITYPDLPVSQRRDEIATAISEHQVVVVAGETGSGKTTQLPKICLELGRGIRGTIGHTQPRRLAARTVAQRIADELSTPLGDAVGYTVRFTDQASDRTLVKLMTDGILLAEIQRDRRLLRYDTLILDEAHERSLNIDFLLGYLRELLPRRPDLKVIVTSATIEPGRFAAHFNGAPIVEVSGRTYPVEIRYRPLEVEAVTDD